MTSDLLALLQESAMLMAVGMGVVFCFLILLIGAMQLLSIFVAKFPEPIEEVSAPAMRASVPSQGPSASVIAAIGAAVHQFRKDNQHG